MLYKETLFREIKMQNLIKFHFTIFLLLILNFFCFPVFSSEDCPSQIKKARNSVFLLFNPYTGYGGTGFLVDSNHLLVTNFHVLQGLLQGGYSLADIIIRYKTSDSETSTRFLQIKNLVALSGSTDLALLKVGKTENLLPLTIRKTPITSEEDRVILGYPREARGNIHISKKTGSSKVFSKMPHFFINYYNAHGFSGGPVMDTQGQVAGVVFLGRENMVISTNVNQLRNFIKGELGVSCVADGDTGKCLNEAIVLLHEKAKKGDIQAQLNLGEMYYSGDRGVEQSYEQAVHWWTLAAEQGDVSAQLLIARAYVHGEGVEQSDEKGFYWAELGAKQGHAIAQSLVGTMYSDGKGVKQSSQDSFYWMELSAKQGYAVAQILLAIAYSEGDGIKQSDKDAIYWAEQAIKQGLDGVRNWLSKNYPHYQQNNQPDDFCMNFSY